MEKMNYIAPDLEVIEFDAEDVIVTSGGNSQSSEEMHLPFIPFG